MYSNVNFHSKEKSYMKIVTQSDGMCIISRKQNLKYCSNIDSFEAIVPSSSLTDKLFIVNNGRTVVEYSLRRKLNEVLNVKQHGSFFLSLSLGSRHGRQDHKRFFFEMKRRFNETFLWPEVIDFKLCLNMKNQNIIINLLFDIFKCHLHTVETVNFCNCCTSTYSSVVPFDVLENSYEAFIDIPEKRFRVSV